MTRVPLHQWVFWGWCTLVVVLYTTLHVVAGLTFPHPWTDESAFLWQAIAFQRHGTLFAPELNPLRDIMQMPPAYMVFMGLLFRVAGFSLTLARTVSLVAMLGAFTLLACALRHLRGSALPIAALGAIWMMVPVVAVGNVARMDSIVLLMGAASLCFFQRERPFAALMSVALAPLFHPNGLFLCAAAAAALLAMRVNRDWPRKQMMMWGVTIVIVAWAWYGFYVAGHWPDFVTDMTFQFQRKASRSLPLWEASSVILMIVVLATALYGYIAFRLPLHFALFGVALWVLFQMGLEMWYECFRGVALVLMAASVLSVALEFVRAGRSFRLSKRVTLAFTVLVVAVGAMTAYQSIHFSKALTRPWTGPWLWMRTADKDVPYLSEADKQSVRNYLRELDGRTHLTRVQFHPPADAMLFVDCETDRVQFYQATFTSLEPDVYIVHVSRYLAPWFSREARNLQEHLHTPWERMLVARDTTELILSGPLGSTRNEYPGQ